MLPRVRFGEHGPRQHPHSKNPTGDRFVVPTLAKERKDGAASSCGHPWSRSARGGPAARINGDFRVCVRARSSLRDFISILVADPAMNRWAKLGRPSDFVGGLA
jgi:hypothetical protein